jgi:hypothetical protein
MGIADEAHRLGVQIIWKPFLLGPILQAPGMENSPFVPAKGELRKQTEEAHPRYLRSADLKQFVNGWLANAVLGDEYEHALAVAANDHWPTPAFGPDGRAFPGRASDAAVGSTGPTREVN